MQEKKQKKDRTPLEDVKIRGEKRKQIKNERGEGGSFRDDKVRKIFYKM